MALASTETTGTALGRVADPTGKDFGPAVALSCRECGARSPLGPDFACTECFGPLEIAYEFPRVTREQIAAGPANIWRYRALLPVPEDVASKPNMAPGWTKLVKADNLARELGLRSLHVKDDSGNPTHSFKDRVVAIAVEAARNFGFHTLSCSSTGNLAGAVTAAARGPGWTPACSSPPTWSRPRSSWPRCTAGAWWPSTAATTT